MIDKIKTKLANRKLREIHFNRNVSFSSFNEIKKIGIIYVYDEENQDNLRNSRLFVEGLKNQDKQVESLVLYPAKKIPESILNKQKEKLISLSETNKLGVPSSDVIDKFSNEEFDLLILASTLDISFMSLLVLKSRARLKIGAEKVSFSETFDLQIILKEENNLRYLLEQIEFYLKKIKTA